MTTLAEISQEAGRLYWLPSVAVPADLDRVTEALCLRGTVAVLDAAGGLVSNLRVWENLILPAWYHRGGALSDWEAPLAEWLTLSGLNELDGRRLLGSLPAMLNLDERRLLVLLRAAVLRPDWLLVDGVWLEWLEQQMLDSPAWRIWAALASVRIVLAAGNPREKYQAIEF